MSVSSKLQNDWPMFPLGKLCEINIGRTPSRNRPEYWGSGYPWLSIADMNQGRDLETTKENITDLAVRECNCQLVPVGTILLSFKLSIGKVGIAHIPLFTNEAIAALPIRDSNKLSSDYLYWALQSIDLTCGLDRAAKGLTLNKAKLVNIEIPVPPLPEQRKIVDILDRAEALRAKRRAALTQLDELIQCIFIEMFGDPARNTKNLPTISLGKLGEWQSGGTPPRGREDYFEGPVSWFSSGELEEMFLFKSKEHISEKALSETSAKSVPKGALMLGMYDTAALKASIAGIDCSCNQAIAFATLNPEIAETVFVYFAILIGREHFRRLQRGVRQKNLNLSMVREISIPLPSLSLQQEFARHVESIEKLKKAHRASLAELDELFASLQHRAFRGELGIIPEINEQNPEGVKI